MLKDITTDICEYFRFCEKIDQRSTPYPPDTLIRTVFHSRYYKYLEDVLKDHPQEQRLFFQMIYQQIIPYICSLLPSSVTIVYMDDLYDPTMKILQNSIVVGIIDLSKYVFEYEESDRISAQSKLINDLSIELSEQQKAIEDAMEAPDISCFFGKSSRIRKRNKRIGDMGIQLEISCQKLADEEAKLEKMIKEELSKRMVIDEISGILMKKLSMPTERKELETASFA